VCGVCDHVFVIPGTDRQRVSNENPAGRRLPRRGQDVRARLVDPRGGVIDSEGPEPKASGLPVEEAAEYARRVEAGHAEPADRPIGGHERASVTVRQERIIADWRERRGCSRTPLLARLSNRRSRLGGAPVVTQGPRERPSPRRTVLWSCHGQASAHREEMTAAGSPRCCAVR